MDTVQIIQRLRGLGLSLSDGEVATMLHQHAEDMSAAQGAFATWGEWQRLPAHPKLRVHQNAVYSVVITEYAALGALCELQTLTQWPRAMYDGGALSIQGVMASARRGEPMKKINHDELSTYQRRAGYNGDLVAVSFLPGGLTNSSVLVGVFLTATDQLTAIKTINRGGELPTDTGQIYHKVISQGEGALDYVQRLAGDIKPEVNTTLFYNAGGTPVAWFQPIAQGATAGGAGPATSDKPD